MTRERGMAAGSPPRSVMPDPATGFRRPSRTGRRGRLMSLRMPHRLLLIAGTASALSLMPAAASAAAPGRYTTIDVPGATATFAVGVNDSGVVSGFYADSSGNDHGFIDRNGAFTTIDVPGAADTVLTVVNDLGVAVGYYTDNSGDSHGFIDRHGRFTTINAPGAGSASGQG